MVPLLFIELCLRFLPVAEGLGALDVNEKNPIFRFKPNQTKQYSKDWDFSLNNKVRINNYGFVNGKDYFPQLDTPLLGVIGDSYVEASMVPYEQTFYGLMKDDVSHGRVYSFAASGAPLSQYLVWANYAREKFKPDGYLFVIISNDFDESLAKYKSAPGFHYYFKTDDGYQLQRVDMKRTKIWYKNILVTLFRNCWLARYFSYNLQAAPRLSMLLAERQEYIGNVSAQVTDERLLDSQTAVELFFRDLPAYTGVDPSKILFVIDGVRPAIYDDETLQSAERSYWATMRQFFIQKAKEHGSPVIDLQPAFINHYKQNQKRFEFVNDAHWNQHGHLVAASEIERSELFQTLFFRDVTEPVK